MHIHNAHIHSDTHTQRVRKMSVRRSVQQFDRILLSAPKTVLCFIGPYHACNVVSRANTHSASIPYFSLELPQTRKNTEHVIAVEELIAAQVNVGQPSHLWSLSNFVRQKS